MNSTGLRLFAAAALQAACLAAALAQAPDPRPFSGEMSKQQLIYQGQGTQAVEGYTVDRGLADYTYALCSGFEQDLDHLGPTDRWLDIGAGTGQAIMDYFTPGYRPDDPDGWKRRSKRGQAVAMSIEDRRTPRWREIAAGAGEGKMRYLSDRSLREYAQEELGLFQLITDVIGGFSYSGDLSLFMERVLALLDLNGSFYTVLQDVHWEAGTNRPHYAGSPFLTEIVTADGTPMNVCSWLKSISCVEVACEVTAGWTPPVEAYRVRKVCKDVSVPPLSLIHFQAGTPPERRFQALSPSPRRPAARIEAGR